jgi:hypothetical protein
MSIGGDAEAAIHRIVPQTRLASLVAKILPYLLLAIVVGVAIWWIMIRPTQLARDGAQAKMDSAIQSGATKAATGALKITVDVQGQRAAIDAQTRSNQDAILSAAGASAPVDPAVYSALHDALCMRAAYQSEPDCAAVRAAGRGVGAAAADTGSGAAIDPGDR